MGNKQSGQLRQLQLTEKSMLVDIANVCDSYNITYYLSCGTLLGAVRHKGYIPWDDDTDIEIPIDDYWRFLSIAQKALGTKYFVQTSMTDPNFNFAYARIRLNNTTFLNPYHKDYKIHQGVWVDVFPLIPVNPGLSVKIKKTVLSISNFMQIQTKIAAHNEEYKKILGPIGVLLVKVFLKIPVDYRQKIHEKTIRLVFSSNPEKCTHRAYVWGNITRVLPREIYDGSPSILSFESSFFKVQHDYKKYLEIVYGDYMTLPPLNQRHGHGNVIIDLENSYTKYI